MWKFAIASPRKGEKMAQIRKRGDGWGISVYLARKNGKKQMHYETFKGTKKEAEKYAAQLESKLKDIVSPDMTLKGYLDTWLLQAERDLQTATYESYLYHYQKILSQLDGKQKLHGVRPIMVQEMVNDLASQGLAAKTIRGTLSTFRTAMRHALALELLPKDPSLGVRTPRIQSKKRNVLSETDFAAYVAAAKYFKHGLILRIVAETGMRPGECLGLSWINVCFRNQNLVINQSVNIKRRFIKDSPKNQHSIRTIGISDELTAMLQAHQDAQGKKAPDELVFSNGRNQPLSYSLVRDTHQRILQRAGLEHLRIYDLRHSTASLLLDEGRSLAYIAELLGHSTVATTASTYVHTVRKATGYFTNSDKLSDKTLKK